MIEILVVFGSFYLFYLIVRNSIRFTLRVFRSILRNRRLRRSKRNGQEKREVTFHFSTGNSTKLAVAQYKIDLLEEALTQKENACAVMQGICGINLSYVSHYEIGQLVA